MEGGMAMAIVMGTAIATIMVILIAIITITMDIPIDIPIVSPIDTRPLLIGEILIMNRGIGPVISDEMKG